MSLPEVLLWRLLRLRPGGFKFRRQQAAGRYVLDFYCSEARLVIEVDGYSPNLGARPVQDAERDAWLQRSGLTVMRIPAAEVLEDVGVVVTGITLQAESLRRPLHQPTAGPPPRAGED